MKKNINKKDKALIIDVLRGGAIVPPFVLFIRRNFGEEIPPKQQPIIIEIIDRHEQVSTAAAVNDTPQYYKINKQIKIALLRSLLVSSIDSAAVNEIVENCKDLAAYKGELITIKDLTNEKDFNS